MGGERPVHDSTTDVLLLRTCATSRSIRGGVLRPSHAHQKVCVPSNSTVLMRSGNRSPAKADVPVNNSAATSMS